jgi:NAD(P)H-hydrate repair Nnr-like enzyme with NAD(P)H-hydrate dehydratase domain
MIESDPITWATKASKLLNVTVLLKGSNTVVVQGDLVISLPKSTPFLATAGSGDVLAGIIGALMATNYIEILNSQERLAHVAATGAFIHNQAALRASQGAPISASDITSNIQEVIRKLIS